jgi:4-hydroxy-tetrahydrodipicolinate reductase
VVVAPNFSISIALFARMSLVLARFAALDQARDPYLVEHHHARKKDAPSGTARLLTKVIMKGCPRKTEWTLQGPGELKEHQLSVSAIRAGHTYSSHTVGIDAPAETLEIHHASRSAMAYADGALRVSDWICGRKGVFTMDQFSQEVLDPLFREVNLS